MKVIPFWGCMIALKYPQMEKAVRYSMDKLGVELVDEPRFSCCPDPIYFKAADKLTWLTLAARNIALAEEHELDIITMCSGCTSTLCEANYHLKKDPELREKVNKSLKAIGREFRGTINVRHVVTLLRDDIGMEKLKHSIERPLKDVKVAIHYGCHLLKPSEIMRVDDPVIPKILQEIIEITGATPINHKEYLLCCGKACQDHELMLNMSADVFESIHASKADCLGLICPTCFDSFDLGQIRVARKVNKEYNLPVIYYFQMLALAQGASLEEVGIKYHKILPREFVMKLQRSGELAAV
ncbi:MAG: CoB--CoM heterodisulfide reductase subunit B [bacterium]|nr:MAG: CoB--CoM heterodisulfide reductase subunit B [bacterium]